MARRRKGDKVDGWLVVDKPQGASSAKAVAIVKRTFNAQKVGHGGTLDPMATGILPIGLGEATKTMPYIVDASKEYDFTVKWGVATDSADAEGEIIHSGGLTPEKSAVEEVLGSFTGTIEQVPPAHSAIKVDGKRAYALARAGETVELKARSVEIQSLTLKSHNADAGESHFSVCCGKGTYVRSLGRDIAEKLGTYGHLTALRRTRVGPFALKDAISLEKLEDLGHSARASDLLRPVTTALDDIPALAVTALEAADIKLGRSIQQSEAKQGLCYLMDGDTPVAIAEVTGEMVRPLRVFNM
ncbi:MAG: tRNA pseudouridine(55) synthase TruB [Kordiimonadaceae bacterium]|nr:tRNA pseudouridine(55) synthase TruB [Kordiimonadaceae bacterium]MBO6568017.1 tRNA pseudouridine(55) synthase TruB [Kordiimonadaceae bacterium]MBO6964253.1 tRNA pseudouridine(55) synthase TruB [Kordiimonadaceae bacterium]